MAHREKMSNVLNAERYNQILKYRLFTTVLGKWLWNTQSHSHVFARFLPATGIRCDLWLVQWIVWQRHDWTVYNNLSWSCPTKSSTCHFVAENFMGIAHVRYIKILTWLRGFRVKTANFSRLHCLAIPRRELSEKKTKPNIEKWPESLGVLLELEYIERGLLKKWKVNIMYVPKKFRFVRGLKRWPSWRYVLYEKNNYLQACKC